MDKKYKKSNSHLNTMRTGLVLRRDGLFYMDDKARRLGNVLEKYRMFAYIPFGSFSSTHFIN